MRSFLLVGGLCLASCQLVSGLGDIQSGIGGGEATSTGVGAGPANSAGQTSGQTDAAATTSDSVSSGSVSSGATTTSGTGSTTASGSSTSSGAGGAASLSPCGGVVDTFDTAIDNAVWTSVNATIQNGHLLVTASAIVSGIHLANTTSFEECYASIEIVGGDVSTNSELSVQKNSLSNYDLISFTNPTITQKPSNTNVGANPKYLGIAFHGGNVSYMYRTATSGWLTIVKLPRDTWMANTDNTIGVGIFNGMSGTQRSFDDFNVVPILLTDL